MRNRILSGALGRALTALGLAAMLVIPAGGAQAVVAPVEAPVTIPAGQNIIDNGNALGARKGEVQAAISKLANEKKYNFYVVLVKSFENPTDPTEWATAVGRAKGLGKFDLMLAIATDEGKSTLQKNSTSKITTAQRDSIMQNAIRPNLLDGKKDYAQAAIDGAAAIGDAAGGGKGTVPNPTGGIVGTVIFLILIIGAVLAFVVIRRRRKQQAVAATASGYSPTGEQLDPMAGTSVEELRTKAGSMLIAADDAIKSSEQEISFAQAAYGDDSVKPFQAALAEAKGHLSESFKLQQQLDDEIPDTIEQQRSWYGEIIRRSEAANQALAEQKQSFDSLRELEKNAPQALATVATGAQQVQAGLQTAQSQLADLQSRFADSATATIKDNIGQAQERLSFVETASQNAAQKLSVQDAASAAVAVRAAEEALHQAKLLEDAIGKVATDVQDAAGKLPAAVAEAQTDLAQAKAMLSAGQNSQAAGQVAAAESVINQVQAQVAQAQSNPAVAKIDPPALLQQVETAHSNLDQLLTGIRDQQQQAQRAQAALQQAILNAQAQISSTQDYIAARRGGVGAEARTRIAEAQRNLDYTLSIQSTDPVSALTYANQATTLAQQAAQLAQSDVDGFGTANSGYGAGGFGGIGRAGSGAGGGFAGGFGGAILGGILGGMLSGGNSHGSSWGGGGFGGWSDGGGGGGGWGGDSGGDGSF